MAAGADAWEKLKETRSRLQKCWNTDIAWSLYPKTLKEGCEKVGKAINVPPIAVLCGYIISASFLMSPSFIEVTGTAWKEPTLVWLTVCMQSGGGKSTLFKHIYMLIESVRFQLGLKDTDPSWVFEDASFEKMGALMRENSCQLLGFYDELSTFLTQINLYHGRALSDSHELALFLQLYNGHPWRRDTVRGDANFVMTSTNLTVGGLTQPAVARSMIEQPSNSEKGLSSRFLWFFPEVLYGTFDDLGEVDQEFVDKLSTLFVKQWKRPTGQDKEAEIKIFKLPEKSTIFKEYYNDIQESLKSLAGMDDFLSGILSKSRGQVLRVAAVLHTLFSIDKGYKKSSTISNDALDDDADDNNAGDNNADKEISNEVSDASLKAAVDFVSVACQHTVYMAGRGLIDEEIERLNQPGQDEISASPVEVNASNNAGYCLTLPGRKLYLTPLLRIKKFRKRGNKYGALSAFYQLEKEGLGKLLELQGSKGTSTHYEFEKAEVPDEKEGKIEMIKKLGKYNVSLSQYE